MHMKFKQKRREKEQVKLVLLNMKARKRKRNKESRQEEKSKQKETPTFKLTSYIETTIDIIKKTFRNQNFSQEDRAYSKGTVRNPEEKGKCEVLIDKI